MTKSEIYAALKAKGIFDTNSNMRDELWAQAFRAHYQETKVKLSPGCGGCMTRIRNWLKS